MPARLSIVVPAYDAERFIGPCLEAIVSQMGPRHALLVVDDGSRDRTADVVEQVRREHPGLRIDLIRQANQGIAGARNSALAAVDGDYILFVDADDLVLPGTLGALDAVIDTHAPDAIACDFNMWHPDSPRKNRRVSLGYAPDAVTHGRDAILATYFADRHTYVWANVLRRAVYSGQPQPVFPVGRAYEDLSVLAALLADCQTLYRLARPTIDYRQHPQSLKNGVSRKWCVDFVSALLQVRQAMAMRGVGDLVRMQVDVAACHFYIGIVKSSYQLPWREGQAAREHVRRIFLDSLFHEADAVLAAMESGAVCSHDPAGDAAAAGQVRKALSGSFTFGLAKTASRALKQWQRRLAA